MTVSSLWKVLDRANCGKLVGTSDLVSGGSINREGRASPLTLAIDLSIWICEGLSSFGLSANHSNPAVYLVFSRAIKLLSLGIKLVVVIEGKRRIRGEKGQDDTFRKRRSGTAFWKACRDCQQMLSLLGVPVVKASKEGEALCALLSQRGIVDGVISNDGDCLLFGATRVYTKFTVENLESAQVVCYDLNDLRAVVDCNENEGADLPMNTVISLSRQDLIAFALLTGSDLAGIGLQNVGHKKAIRFIHKCQEDFPLSKETATIDDLRAWARVAAVTHSDTVNQDAHLVGKCCSRCHHGGSKTSHAKHGCEQCGTAPGEPCYQLSVEDKFRNSLRTKALAVQPPFEPSLVYEAYMRPNDNQMPLQLVNQSSESLAMSYPSLQKLIRIPIVVIGVGLSQSQDYIKQAVSRYLSRYELFQSSKPLSLHSVPSGQTLSRERPIPQRITKRLVQNALPCYEVTWVVEATITNDDGEGINGYEYTTVEPQDLVDSRYPKLVEAFLCVERERKKQGDAEQVRRQLFLENVLGGEHIGGHNESIDRSHGRKKRLDKQIKQRQGFFDKKRAMVSTEQDERNRKKTTGNGIDGVAKCGLKNDAASPLGMIIHTETRMTPPHPLLKHQSWDPKETFDKGLYCQMGGMMIEMSPLVASLPVGVSPVRRGVVAFDKKVNDFL